MLPEITPVRWRERKRVPREFAGALEALRPQKPDYSLLESLREKEWLRLLPRCDREHLTLPLYRACNHLPPPIARRVQANLASNSERVERVRTAFRDIAEAFTRTGIEFAVLKGFAQSPDYVADLKYRVQYDLDFFCPGESVFRARDALLGLGYEAIPEMEGFPTDHLPVMIRKTGWEWRGDFYDPDIPVSVDLHFRFWDRATEGFDVPAAGTFWERRVQREIGGLAYTGLHQTDALAYHSLHLLRHLLRSSLRTSHVYELACFLHGHAGDEAFWRTWRELHGESLRRVQSIAFALSVLWFPCAIPPQVEEEFRQLPEGVVDWLQRYGAAPLESLFHPNKHEIWLHLQLVESRAAARKVLPRRLLPVRLPGPVDAVHIPEEKMTPRIRLRRQARYIGHLARRAFHHLRVLPSVALHGLLLRESPGGDFWRFIGAASLANLGQFVFYLLYNLYLLDRGFEEGSLGLIASASTAGSLVGALPAGYLLHRIGLRNSVLLCFGAMGSVSALRVVVPGVAALTALAFLAGCAFALWAVSIPPIIAGLTTERTRARGFSLFFAISVAIGVLGGVVGGQLPGLLSKTGVIAGAAEATQTAILIGSLFPFLALLPAAGLRFPRTEGQPRRAYPFGPFMRRFLLALFGWNLAVGAFNPFFNAYFAQRLQLDAGEIGAIFSSGQMLQALAILAAPRILSKLGLIRGVMSMQLATGAALAGLALTTTTGAAAASYIAFMVFQFMSEPGIYTLLMGRVRPEEQGGASALNSMAGFAAHALAASLAGAAYARFGYPAVLAAVSALAMISAFLFRYLLRGVHSAPEPSPSFQANRNS